MIILMPSLPITHLELVRKLDVPPIVRDSRTIWISRIR